MAIDPCIFSYLTREEDYPDKAVIVQEGSHGGWVYVVLQGKVKVKKNTPKGTVAFATLSEGEVFGELVLLERGQLARTAAVVAEGPVRVGVLDTERLIQDYEAISPRLLSLIKVLMIRLRDTTEKAVTLAAEASKGS